MLAPLGDHERARITTYLVDQHRLGVEIPELDGEVVSRVAGGKSLPVHERADRLLVHLAGETEYLGERVPYVMAEASGHELLAVSESTNDEEIEFLLSYLNSTELCDVEQILGGAGEVAVTVGGYERLAELSSSNVQSEQAFVAMWFDSSTDEAFDKGIQRGIEDAGYRPMRIDRKDHNNKIDDEIIAEIRRSRFLVADFTHGDTGARGGVYYEAGFAHGLGIPVIFTCKDDMIGKTHFDTRQYSHILWSSPDDLRKKLANRISATIGDGPGK